jgi:hypothetical protein
LLRATDDERAGYLQDVMYSCGGLIYADQLWLPYAVCDRATRIAQVPLLELLTQLTPASLWQAELEYPNQHVRMALCHGC